MKSACFLLNLCFCVTTHIAAAGEETDKTLVVWVIPANLDQRGGSALTQAQIGVLKPNEKSAIEPLAWSNLTIQAGSEHALEQIQGDALELELVIAAPLPKECGIRLLADENGQEGLDVAMGANSKELKIGPCKPPFALKEGEDLRLRVFVDKNLV